ncbi:glutathione transferase GstA [Shimia sp.]|uniref:glutathione transferase GstA n=1 Tax=Shimia sp. TaxID=1954381 RepID=UPI003BA8B5D1
MPSHLCLSSTEKDEEMKLYYKPGACSLASHIALQEIGAVFDIESVDTDAGRTHSGADYSKVNPKGYVPALQLADGEVLTEGPAILQFLADTNPAAGLSPEVGSLLRARMQEQLTFVSSELHKAFSPLFSSDITEEGKSNARAAVARKFDVLEQHFSDGRQMLVGDQFTVADAYLFVVANWANFTGINLADWPQLAAFVARISEKPTVQRALRAEGLLQ